MDQLIIDHPQGYDTIWSEEEDSPACPYLVRHRPPQSVDDLYDLGLISKFVPRDALIEARAAGAAAASRYLRVTDQTLFAASRTAQRTLVEARLNTQARDTRVRAAADHLAAALRIDSVQAEILALKAHSIDAAHDTISPDRERFVYSLKLQSDLVVKSRLVVAASITIIRARSVLIHRTGELRMRGRYILLECESIYGPGLWEYLSDRITEKVHPRYVAEG